jgi:hypothetical protein
MNRRDRRRYAAELRALAATGMELADVGRCESGWTCDCTACRLVRAGVCFRCAALLTAQILERKAGDTFNASLCSPSCREGAEWYFSERLKE